MNTHAINKGYYPHYNTLSYGRILANGGVGLGCEGMRSRVAESEGVGFGWWRQQAIRKNGFAFIKY